VNYTVCVPKQKTETYNETVCQLVQRKQTEKYTVCVPVNVTKSVTVQVCKMVPQKVTVQVPVGPACQPASACTAACNCCGG